MAEQQEAKFEWHRYMPHYLIFLLVSAILLCGFSCGSPYCQFWLWLSPDGCGFSPFKVFHYDEQLAFVALFFSSLSAVAAFLYYKKASRKSYLLLPIHAALLLLITVPCNGMWLFHADCDGSSSISYWRGEARPIAILEHDFSAGNGSGVLIIQNIDTQTHTILNLFVSNASYSPAGGGIRMEPGYMVDIAMNGVPTGTLGSVYQFPVNITYRNEDGIVETEYGAKNIVGKYI